MIVDGAVEGPIRGTDVTLKSRAHVTGDVHHTTLSVEKGARFDGRSRQTDTAPTKTAARAVSTPPKTEKLEKTEKTEKVRTAA